MQESGFNFIIGIGRSGTTLLMSMLNAHPTIQATPEINFFVFFHNSWKNRTKFNLDDVVHVERYIDFGFDKTKLDHLKWKSFSDVYKNFYECFVYNSKTKNISTYFDKNPINTLYVDEILKSMPNAKFLLIVRDPRANYLSRKEKQNKRSSNIYFNCLRWNFYSDKAYYFSKKFPNSVYVLRYEDLVNSPEQYLKDLSVFFNFDYHENLLSFHHSIGTNEKVTEKDSRLSVKYSDLSKPINTSRVNVWQQKLTEKEIAILNYVNGDFARNFGYKIETSKSNNVNLISLTLNRLRFDVSRFKEFFITKLPLNIKLKIIS
jgi:glutaredoxin-related protein